MAGYNSDSIDSIDPTAGTGSPPNGMGGIDDMGGIAIPSWGLTAAAQATAMTGLQAIREDASESVHFHCVPSPSPATFADNNPRRRIVVTRTGRIAGTITKQEEEPTTVPMMRALMASTSPRAGKSPRRHRSKASSPLPIPLGSTLPLDHQPARGRGRAQQLRTMTQDQIQVETIARVEKNRKAARDARLRKKQHTEILEARVRELEVKDAESQKLISQLQNRIHQLELGI